MRVLVGCERFGVIRDAFTVRGHDAVSCDLVPALGRHLTTDVRLALKYHGPWDLFICHPDCTFLTVANTYLKRGCAKYTAEMAVTYRREAEDFFMEMVNADVPKVAVENPIGIMSTRYRKPNQIIQPWQFGEDASKSTCLWLKNLPKLQGTQDVPPRYVCAACGRTGEPTCAVRLCRGCGSPKIRRRWGNQTDSGQNRLGPSEERAMLRARTYPGIAESMAEQWGG